MKTKTKQNVGNCLNKTIQAIDCVSLKKESGRRRREQQHVAFDVRRTQFLHLTNSFLFQIVSFVVAF